jgi:Cu-Zn family superoxide dismutase
MPHTYARFTLSLFAAAAVAACAGNPSPEDTAAVDSAADTTANANVMAAPTPDTVRADTTMMPPADTTTVPRADTTMMPRADTTMAPPTDTTMMPPAHDTTMAMPADTAAVPPASDTTMAPPDTTMAANAAAGAAATAQMKGTGGRDLGTLTLSESGGSITVSGQLAGLPPGEHGFHIHTTGKCDGPSFETAGAHWNPTNKGHGTNNPAGPHLGDMANITVGADSSVSVQATTPGGSLHGENALLDGDGAAIVIHAKADDYKSNPSGNSGNRIACGVVTGG